MAVDPSRTPGTFGAPPPDAPRERTHAEDPVAQAARAAIARANERSLAPLVFEVKTPAPPPVLGPTPIPPSQSRLRVPGAQKPPVTVAAETVPAPAHGAIILTDAPGVPVDKREGGITASPPMAVLDSSSEAVQVGQGALTHETPIPRIERPAVDAATSAHLASPLADAARKLAAQRALSHQPAASDTDSPARGVPTPSADPGKQITGGFGDAGDAQYFPLDGSELRELVRGLLSVIDAQLDNDLRFSMAICYPRVAARVVVEISAYAAGGDGGQYDPSFAIAKVAPPHDKTPLAIARARADEVVFVVVADRVEMSAAGESIAPPNLIRAELGLTVPRKQVVQTPHGRLIVDLRA